MPRDSAILFDLEGIVIDTEPIWDESTRLLLGRRGIQANRLELKAKLAGRSMTQGVHMMQERYGFSGAVEDIAAERREIVRELLASQVGWIDGFTDFFARLQPSIPRCVATSMERSLMERVDTQLVISDRFDQQVYFAEDAGAHKPDPAVFLYAAKALRVSPTACVVLEDSPNGIAAAKAAGMHCVALSTTFPSERLEEADEVYAGYEEMAAGSEIVKGLIQH